MHIFHKILMVGCGDIGKRVARSLLEEGNQVSAISHSQMSHKSLRESGITVIDADLDDKNSLQKINQTFDYIFYFAPPPSHGVTDTRVANFLSNYLIDHPAKRLLYISTTGVYGNHNNEWIDENTEVNPDNDRSRRRLDAELQIKQHAEKTAMEYIIIRVAGIYSLEKLPLDRLKAGMKILDRKLSSASNRIHSDDLSLICIKAMFNAPNGEIFNAADGHPSTMSDYFIKTAEAFNLPKPEEVDWDYADSHFSPALLSYLHESKKIRNDKLHKMLHLKLSYPTLVQGLEQCLEQYKNET